MFFFSKKQKNKTAEKSWQGRQSRVVSLKPRKKEKKRKKGFSRFLFWLLFLAFLGICAYLLIFSPFTQISSVFIEGNREISSKEIAKNLEKYFSGKYFGFLPQNNFFLTSRKGVGNAVKSVSNRLEIVSVRKKFPDKIEIQVNELKAEIAWCSGGVCYFVDKSGLVYSGANLDEENLRNSGFLVLVDDSARLVAIGETRINPEFIQFLENTAELVGGDLGLQTAGSFHTPGEASEEADIFISEGWILRIRSEYDREEVKKIIQTLFERDLKQEIRQNLEYLDLTVKNKIYYKMKNTQEEEEKNGSEE